MIEKTPITKEGLEKLKKELNKIIKLERPKNIKDIEEARAHGDLSENAEYHAAKERQSFLGARMNELEMVINRSEVIDINNLNTERIIFGTTVELRNITSNKKITYQLVGPYESDPGDGKISVSSPVGRVLIGNEEGDEVKIKTPGGLQEFEILEIR
ncbi:MAG: transcription elongation factor GreA [Thermodesulfobacteriota bacterium]|nr:transcription elongation factor GreA [Thermodesulfobacteriota bacterium]